MTILEICAAILTLALVVFIFYLIQTLRRSQKILQKVEKNIDPLALETIELIRNSKDLTKSVDHKINNFDPLLRSINNVGEAVESVTESLHHTAEKKSPYTDKIIDLMEILGVGIVIWQEFKKRR